MIWIAFNLVLALLIFVDITLRKNREMKAPEALLWTGFWVAIALLFNALLYFTYSKQAALEFFTGYLIEKSLSVDNLFVFLLIFTTFKTEKKNQLKILSYGVCGALVMRLVFILGGISIIGMFHWILYFFGAFLILTGLIMLRKKEAHFVPQENYFLKCAKKIIPFQADDVDGKFFVWNHEKARYFATPLFATLVAVEAADLIFAFDSIPAIFGVTLDPFIVYSSNALAILGLRALYFALSDSLRYFKYLHHGVSLILVFIGFKMVLEPFITVPITLSLGIIASILILSILLSVYNKK